MKTKFNTFPTHQAHLRPVAVDVSPRTLKQDEISADSGRWLPFAGSRASRCLTLLAALALLLGAHMAQAADVFFNDGGTHTISDATYQNDSIQVANNTTLNIEPGAILGGGDDYSGVIHALDTSKVTINGGVFGSTGSHSGAIFAWNSSTVTITGGTLGGSGPESGSVWGFDSSTVRINSGIFGGAGILAGEVRAYDTSSLTINGGTFGGTGAWSGMIRSDGSASVTIHGGDFGGTGDSSGSVEACDTSTVTINGGTFGSVGGASGSVVAYWWGVVKITGGVFGGTGVSSGMVGTADDDDSSSIPTLTVSGGVFGGTGDYSGIISIPCNSAVTFQAASYDTGAFDATSGGILGVTFCSQSPQQITVVNYGLATVSLEVACETPGELISALIAEVNGLSIKAATKNALVVKLNAALKALSLGDTATACARLQDFIGLCVSQTGKKLVPVELAEQLIVEAQHIRKLIGCP